MPPNLLIAFLYFPFLAAETMVLKIRALSWFRQLWLSQHPPHLFYLSCCSCPELPELRRLILGSSEASFVPQACSIDKALLAATEQKPSLTLPSRIDGIGGVAGNVGKG